MSDNGGSSDGNETPSGKSSDSSPSGSDTPESPPSPDSSNPSPDSPPSDSKNTPSDSGKSSPSPETPPNSDNSSPPPPPPESDSSPPPDSNGGDPPPSDSNNDSAPSKSSPPPPSDNNNSPSDSSPAPKSSNDSPPKSDKGSKNSPPSDNNNNSPDNDNHNSPPRTQDSPPSRDGTQSNHSSSHVPELSGPSTHSSRTPSTQIDIGAVVGVTVAGVLIFALIASVCHNKKEEKRPLKYDPYGAPPPNYSANSGYYNGPHSQQHLIAGMPGGYSQEYYSGGRPGGHSQEYHSGGRPSAYPNSGPINSYSSYKGPDSGTLMSGAQSRICSKNVIGEGGFGAVYKGYLPDGRTVAVKQLKAGSGQGEREFRAEVDIISRVHHRHLVSLVGYCIADAQRLLVYEFVPNNTLEHHIHSELLMLIGPKRVKIAISSARGLAYLHEDYFGLAKLSNDITTHVSTRVMGTFGYMAPEYASSGKLTDRSDVFSFGVVLLELVTGRRPIDPSLQDESLVEWSSTTDSKCNRGGDFSELVDSRLENRYVESEMFKMAETAAACVRHSATKRPRMVQVLRALDTDGDMPDINNGVKVGQSTIFETNSDLQKFRMLALGGNDSADYSTYSGSVNSRANILPPKPPPGWSG
ncbi:hypothetical protein MKW92_013176 [Papaver armeniacum]|nr:hypothetical protein MKW92_013176 [Papaver armeniacum]